MDTRLSVSQQQALITKQTAYLAPLDVCPADQWYFSLHSAGEAAPGTRSLVLDTPLQKGIWRNKRGYSRRPRAQDLGRLARKLGLLILAKRKLERSDNRRVTNESQPLLTSAGQQNKGQQSTALEVQAGFRKSLFTGTLVQH